MKDAPQIYGPQVIEILGYNPNTTERTPLEPRTPIVAIDKPVPFDIALEFNRRISSELQDEEHPWKINQNHLLMISGTGDKITRTYFDYLPGQPPRKQTFNPVQRLTLEKNRKGIFTITGIYLTTTHPDRIWKTVTFAIDPRHVIIEARAANDTSKTLKVDYAPSNTRPIIYLDGDPTPLDDRTPLYEGSADLFLYEGSGSSIIVPDSYQSGAVLSSIPINAGLGLYPENPDNISDKGYNNTKDPLKAALIRWVP